ncbi:MAG: geranylgeranyl reductase family protein [Propionibacteriaceae bacterium]|jgi:geranylgeranyl reductase family protein|nr:geranylgeranyl reductase family protein [Propionibacteriaceae bacterium]
MSGPVESADVIVVGAGPAGSAAAIHLAGAGLDVLLLEKAVFPREKVCGDGLTPRAVRELAGLGLDTRPEAGWRHNLGLRIWAGRPYPYLMPWPVLADFPAYGLVRRRADFDALLADRAVQAGARLVQPVTVTAPILNRAGRVVGVQTKDGAQYQAPLTLACDGNSARLAIAAGRDRRLDRPMGVAVRAYYASPRADDLWLESWLELWDGPPGRSHLLPGYGWSFPLGDGLCNVGLGLTDSSTGFGRVDYRDLLRRWLDTTPPEWGFREANRQGKIGSAALPMGFNRQPIYQDGLLLAGDAAGLINPFNGEGISYALESGRYAAQQIVQARSRGLGSAPAERALRAYPERLRRAWGGYFRLGAVFGRIIGHPGVMRLATRYGLPVPAVRQLVHRLLANLSDQPPRDVYDVVVNTLSRLTPSA